MRKNCYFIFVTILLLAQICFGLEVKSQTRHNPNVDFILNESGGNKNNLQDNAASTSNHQVPKPSNTPENTRKSDPFPPLPPSRTTQKTTLQNTQTNSGSSSYSQSAKRDYVAPQLPNQRPSSSNLGPNVNTSGSSDNNSDKKQSNNEKRDYVSPKFPELRPSQSNQQTGGKVQDLVNFYNNNNNQANNQNSYSSVLKGTGTTTTIKNLPTLAPVALKPLNPSVQTTTKKPTTQFTTPRTILPSSLINSTSNIYGNNNNGNSPSNADLQTISEELLRRDVNNAARYITVNYQGRVTSQYNQDMAPQPLMTVAPDAWNIPTVQKIIPLLDNYERDTSINEYVTPQERAEENEFMDTIMSTSVIRTLMNFLKDRGYVTPDPRQQRDFLKQLWFGLYSRGQGKISSSGFEHVFVSELKQGDVMGLHNWIYYAKEEIRNHVNYLGYSNYLTLNEKGYIAKIRFSQDGVLKPTNSLFIGTSPEFEIALYTLCYVTRVNDDCKVKLSGKDDLAPQLSCTDSGCVGNKISHVPPLVKSVWRTSEASDLVCCACVPQNATV